MIIKISLDLNYSIIYINLFLLFFIDDPFKDS